MRYWVGVTDNNWFDFLSKRLPEEVNFWQPSGRNTFRAISSGETFVFKLHSPLNYIAGGGIFVRHSILPLSLAWEAFEEKNGALSFESFRSRVMSYRSQYKVFEPDPMIGCIILAEPFFLPREEWIQISNWDRNIVRGKTYDTNESVGAFLWATLQNKLQAQTKETLAIAEERMPYNDNEYLTRVRLGQGAFRVLVTEVYNRRCAVTEERTLPVLEAAHIKPVSKSGPHRINNGLLLRTDLHKLFDLGYLTINDDYHIEVSKRIREEYENGREYYKLHGKLINLPLSLSDRPLKEYIDWHNLNVYVS